MHRRALEASAAVRSPALERLEERILLSLTVTIDYSLDTNNFFNTQQKKDTLALAAAHVTSFLSDTLDAIVPSGGNTWTAKFTHPGTGAQQHSISNRTIQQDEIVIYAGGRDLGPSGSGLVLGLGGPGGFGASSTTGQGWIDTVKSRGEAGALLAAPTDFGPWGGSISFTTNAGVTFFFGSPTESIPAGQTSFFSVAVHEVMHLMGFGTADSWDELVPDQTTQFTGPKSQIEYDAGGPVPLHPLLGHWAEGTTEAGQPTIMDPTVNANGRYMTVLDLAGLDDIGWELKSGLFTDVGAGLPGVEAPGLDFGDFDNDGDLDIAMQGGNTGIVTRIFRNDGGAFVPTGAPSPQTHWRALEWGDYDNDGDLDLFHAGWDGGAPNARLLRNDGGTFNPLPANTFMGLKEADAEWLDFDNDGDLDLLLAGEDKSNGSDHTLLYRNDDGAFSIAQTLSGFRLSAIAAGDYDDDGDVDLLLSGENNGPLATRLYRNDGGTYVEVGHQFANVGWAGMEWGDYDNDGDLDLAVAGNTGTGSLLVSKIYRNNGGGSFTDIGASLVPLERATLAWGDYDNDGDLDLVMAGLSATGRTTRLYNNNGGAFVDANAGLIGVDTTDVAWGDYDNDGDLDLVVAGMSDLGRVTRVYRNNSAVANTAPLAPTGLSDSVEDGVATLMWGPGSDGQTPVSGLSYNLRIGTTPGGSDIFSGHSNTTTGQRRVADLGSAQQVLSYDIKHLPTGTYYWSVQSIDGAFAGSNWAAENTFDVVEVLPAFTAVPTGLPGVGAAGIDWGDFDNDGDLDLALKGSQGTNPKVTRIYRNDAGGFVDIGAPALQTEWRAIDWGDYDNDGDLDLFHVGWDGGAPNSRLLRNDNGVFNPLPDMFVGVTEPDSEWLDFDNDGDLDMLITGIGTSRLYRNNGSDSFTVAQNLQGLHHSAIAAGDYDNDGDIDLLLTGGNQGPILTKFYRNDAGTFVDIPSPFFNTAWAGAEWGDYDSDGDLDLALAGGTLSSGVFNTKIYRNNGGGSFTDIGATLVGVERATLGWGDADNDGDLDLVVAGLSANGRTTRLYTNDAGTFVDANVGFVGVDSTDLAWGDYDNDGDLDLLIAGTSATGHVTQLYRNNATPANTNPNAPTNLSDSATTNSAILSWSPGTDDQTPAAGLTYNLRIGTTPGGSDILSPTSNPASGFHKLAEMGSVQQALSWTIKDLPKGTYYWSVQSIDTSFNGSQWAPENQFEVANTPPVAANDSYNVAAAGPTSVAAASGVLKNDSDANNDPLTAALVDNVDFGTLAFNSDGSFTYTPSASFPGFDSFTYRANDGTDDSNVVSVTLGAVVMVPTKITASDGAAGDEFGIHTAIWGNLAIVGAAGDDDRGNKAGAAYIYQRDTQGVWQQLTKLTASDGAADDLFGHAVDISGNRVIIGAHEANAVGSNSGAAYIFERQADGSWKQTKLTASDAAAGDLFAHSVAIWGDYALVGAHENDDAGGNSGSAYVFERQASGAWTQVGKLTASDAQAGDFFGANLSLDGGRAVIGAMQDDDLGSDAGSAYVFDRNPNGQWQQVAKLKASNGMAGDAFGRATSVSGDRVLISGWRHDVSGFGDAGQAYIFERQAGGNWIETSILNATDPSADKRFGTKVAISGNLALVGAIGDAGTGAAYAFERLPNGAWSGPKLAAFDAGGGDDFGISVDVAGNRGIIGAFGDDDKGSDAGAAYVRETTAANPLAPIAALDSYLATGPIFTVDTASGVLANDTDANVDNLTAALVSDVSNGELTLNPNGSFTYTPDAGFFGTDTFTYRASDGQLDSQIVTVKLDVVLGMSVADVSITEGSSGNVNLVFTVTLAEASSQTVTVNYATASGTAVANDDYLAANGQLTFTPGQTSRTVAVSVIGDSLVELDETLFLSLSNATVATIVDAQAVGTISNDDSAVVTITDAARIEGDASNLPLAFTVTLSNPVDTAVTVLVNTADGTATVADNDYVPIAGQQVTFTPGGSLTQVVNVSIVGDVVIEPGEDFTLGLSGLASSGRSVTIGDSSGKGMIIDDDQPLVVTAVAPSITIDSDANSRVTGFFDLTFDVPAGVMESIAAWNVQLSIEPIAGVIFTGASEAANAIFPGLTPQVFQTGDSLLLGSNLDVGEPDRAITDGAGLARVLFEVDKGVSGEFEVVFDFLLLFEGEQGDEVANLTVNGQITVIADVTPPVVEAVQVDGTEWVAQFPFADGYAIPTGSDQLDPLPWVNTDQLRIVFSEHTDVQESDLFVRGVNVEEYAISGFAYDATSFTATWTLAAPINSDKILIGFNRAIEDEFGNVLDGDWINGANTYPSGDGAAGGDFHYRINILPGDVTQDFRVLGDDLIRVRNTQFQFPGSTGYSPFNDVNASGSIFGNDVILVRNRQFSALPGNDPTPPPAPLMLTESSGEQMESLLASMEPVSPPPAAIPAKMGVPWSTRWIQLHERPAFSIARFQANDGLLPSALIKRIAFKNAFMEAQSSLTD